MTRKASLLCCQSLAVCLVIMCALAGGASQLQSQGSVIQRTSPQIVAPVPYRSSEPQPLSLFGVSLGQSLGELERSFPDQWKRGYSDEAGFHLYRMPNAPAGEPGIIVSAGDSTPNDGLVRRVIVFAFNPSDDYFSPSVVAQALEMAWGTAIRFDGLEHDRLWVNLKQHAAVRIRYTKEPYPPKILIELSAYHPPP